MAQCAERLLRVAAALAQRPEHRTVVVGFPDTARLRPCCLSILAAAVGPDGGRCAAAAAAAGGLGPAASRDTAARDAVLRALGGEDGAMGLARCLVLCGPSGYSPP